ncbi:MAG TPA: hypothetical protein VGE76_13350 [Opitutaceae bacterium]
MTPAKISPTQIAAAGLAGVLVLLVAVLVHLRRQVEAAEREASMNAQSLVTEKSQVEAARQRLARFEKLAKQAEARQAQPPLARALVSLAPHYRDNPELTRTYFRPMIRRHFAALFVPGVLSRQQQEELETLLLRLGPTLDMMGQNGLGWDEPGQNALMTRALGAELEPEVRATLGDAIGDRFRETLRTRDVQLALDDLSMKLLHAGAPLDQATSAQLTALLLEAGKATPPEHRLRLQTLDWDLVMQRAPSVLSATQLRALAALKARALFDQEYERASGYTVGPRLPEPEL